MCVAAGSLIASEKNLWVEDYAEASQMAQLTDKPLLLAFVGSDWCPWSQKLGAEILGKSEFLEEMQKETILVWVDFPEHRTMPAESQAQNEKLKEQFQVSELPTLVLVDSSGSCIAKFSYLPLTPKEMAGQLKTALNDFAELEKVIHSSVLGELDGEKVKTLYKKAVQLGREEEKKALLEKGLKTNERPFFLMRQYEGLIEHAKLKDPEVQKLRREIMQKDPGNHKGIHLELAITEFQTLSKKLKRKENPEKAVMPLIEYVRNYGSKDLENSWRVEMMIAQFLYSKNRLQEAVTHAKMSYEYAPHEYQEEVAKTLEFLAAKTSKK